MSRGRNGSGGAHPLWRRGQEELSGRAHEWQGLRWGRCSRVGWSAIGLAIVVG